MSNV
ncbi:hypothetical protein VTH06DRAFT_7059 [Thermothelomyces fergusii]|jgi:hypothetical protein